MAVGLNVGETVFVPVSMLKRVVSSPSAFHQSPVLGFEGRKARINVGQGETELVATSKCQRNIGIAILSIGDFESEAALIDPMSKSILQFCRLLCSDEYVRFHKVRSIAELKQVWALYYAIYSHVIIIGHGNGAALKFAVDGWASPEAVRDALSPAGVTPKCFLNLSCELGKAAYGKGFSKLSVCEAFIAPFQSVHGAVASQFAQSFLIFHLLEGKTLKIAFHYARNWVAGSTSFRMWRYGQMITDT